MGLTYLGLAAVGRAFRIRSSRLTRIVYYAMRDDLTIPPEGLRRDVWQFFSLPIPSAVWEKVKVLQDDAFVAYVESCLHWK